MADRGVEYDNHPINAGTMNNSTQIKSVLGAIKDPLLKSGFQFATQQLEGRQSITTGVQTNDAYKSPVNGAAFPDSVTNTNDIVSSMMYEGHQRLPLHSGFISMQEGQIQPDSIEHLNKERHNQSYERGSDSLYQGISQFEQAEGLQLDDKNALKGEIQELVTPDALFISPDGPLKEETQVFMN